MLEIIGLVILGIWASKNARQRNRNSLTWGIAAVGIYLSFYFVIFLLVKKGFEYMFDRASDSSVATFIFSLGLVGISFAFASYMTLKLMDKKF